MSEKLVLYIEPLNGGTNRLVAETLKNLGNMTEDEFSAHKDDKNSPHPRWECPYRVVSALVQEGKKNTSIKFKIWIKDGRGFKDGEFMFRRKKAALPRSKMKNK